MGAVLLLAVISWQITQEPLTSSTRSEVYGFTGISRIEGGGFPPETRETFYTNGTTTYETHNWSRTTTSSTEYFTDIIYVTYITNSTSTPQGTEYSQDPSSGGESDQGVASLTKTRHLQSSTVVSASTIATRTATTTRTSLHVEFASSSFAFSTSQITALTQTTQSTTTSIASTTTLTQTELDPSYYATIYRVQGTNQILWCLDASSVTFDGGFSAASALATTATQTTFQPWSQTTNLSGFVGSGTYLSPSLGVLLAPTNETGTRPELVSVYDITDITTTSAIATTAIFGELPMSTSEFFQVVGTTQTMQSSVTLRQPQNVVAFRTTAQTRFGNAGRIGPQIFNAIDTIEGASVTDSYKTVEIVSSNSNAVRTITFISPQSNATTSGGTDVGGVGWALRPQAVTTRMGFKKALIIGQRGVAATGSGAALFYSANTTLTLGGDYTALDDRNVTTIMPGTYAATGNFGTGAVSFAGLSASFTLRTSTSESTGTFSLSPNGSSQTTLVANASTVVIGAGLGKRETLAYTIAPGVYSDVARSTTFSTSGEVKSYASGATEEVSILHPISFVVPGATNADVSPLVWTAERNSTTPTA